MAPKKKTAKVTFANTSENKPGNPVQPKNILRDYFQKTAPMSTSLASKRKKRSTSSTSDVEQTPPKKQRRQDLENKLVRVSKAKVQKPISADIVQHIESLINTAILSVVSKKRTTDFEHVQAQLTRLKQQMFQHIKKMKCPSCKLGNMKNLKRDLAEEQHKLENNQEILNSLNNEVEQAVDEAEAIEDSTKALEEKLQSLTEQPAVINSDPLELPKATFEAPTFQEKAKALKNPKAVLKELSLMQSNPVYKGMQELLRKSYAEVYLATESSGI